MQIELQHLEELWQTFLLDYVPVDTPEEVVRALRVAFYFGATAASTGAL